jgi:hypothetical protein
MGAGTPVIETLMCAMNIEVQEDGAHFITTPPYVFFRTVEPFYLHLETTAASDALGNLLLQQGPVPVGRASQLPAPVLRRDHSGR